MKVLFTFSIALLFSSFTFAQSGSLTVENQTTCGYIVKAFAQDTICDSSCATVATCIQPFSTVYLSGCSDTTLTWDRILVEPVNAEDCSYCRERGTSVGSSYGNNCLGLPTSSLSNPHCEGCEYSVTFSGPSHVIIN